jgi:hypothetical protein
MKKKPVRISRWEWDFSQCDPAELRDCYYYEFTREFPIVCNLVAKWRTAHKGSRFDDWRPIFSKNNRDNRPRAFSYELFNFCPEWPEQPYLSIAKNERLRRRHLNQQPPPRSDKSNALEQVNMPMIIRDHIERGIKSEPPLDELERGVIKQDDGLHEIAAFKIDWRHTDGILGECFAYWLKHYRPKGIAQWKIKGKGRRHEQMMKNLKALGAWRLLNKMPWKVAADVTSELNDEAKPLFGEQPNWIRARKHAENLMTKFKGSEFL